MAIKTTTTELPESRVRVEAEVPPDEVERRVQQAARELGRQLRIPGFRKGKVPPPVVIRRLGREAVVDEALQSSLSRWYREAIEGAGIAPVGDPELKLESHPSEGEPFSFSIEIGVRPQARLGDYKGLEVGRREPHADPKQVDQELESLRERVATLEQVDRPAQNGDFVVIDYTGTVAGEQLDGAEGRDQLLELGTGRLLPGFDEQLTGAAAGDQRAVAVTFPDDHPEHLRGREANFDVTVKEVKAKQLPALDDDFASEYAGFDSLKELKEDIASRLREGDERAVQAEFERAAVDAAVEHAQIEVPDRLVHARAHELVGETLHALEHQGISKEAYLRIAGSDEETLAREAEPEAAAALRREAVLAAVVKAEGIAPPDEELVEELRPLAERDGRKPEKLLEELRKRGTLESLRAELASRQAVALLVREAKAIPEDQARAREKLWTPEKEAAEGGSAQLWTPGSEPERPRRKPRK